MMNIDEIVKKSQRFNFRTKSNWSKKIHWRAQKWTRWILWQINSDGF